MQGHQETCTRWIFLTNLIKCWQVMQKKYLKWPLKWPLIKTKYTCGVCHDAMMMMVMTIARNALTGDGVVAGGECCEGLHIPQEDGLVQPSRGHLLPVPSIGQRPHIVFVGPQCWHAEALCGTSVTHNKDEMGCFSVFIKFFMPIYQHDHNSIYRYNF